MFNVDNGQLGLGLGFGQNRHTFGDTFEQIRIPILVVIFHQPSTVITLQLKEYTYQNMEEIIPQEIPANISTRETAYEDFHRQGYVVIPEVLSRDQIEQLKTIIDKQSQATRDHKMKKKKRKA